MLWRIGYLLLLAYIFRVGIVPTVGRPTPQPWFPHEYEAARAVAAAVILREGILTTKQVIRRGRWHWRRLVRWLPGRKADRKVSDVETAARRQAEQLFPEQPPDYFTIGELAAVTLLKGSLGGLWQMVPEAVCASLFLKIRWAGGIRCVFCHSAAHLHVKQTCYRTYFRRYRCGACSRKAGHEVTFNDLTGTLLEQSRLSVRKWLWAQTWFIEGVTAQTLAKRLGVNRKTGQRLVRLFQTALFTQRFVRLLQGPVEADEIYLIAGSKGRAGGKPLARKARCRGLKRRGRGRWETDKPPVLGLVDRGGQVFLIVLPNVQTKVLRPLIEHLVAPGAQIHTDAYSVYKFLEKAGFLHESVNHSAGEYARGDVHINTCEALWSLLRAALAIHRGVSKLYLPLYVASFEFRHNRRSQGEWAATVDLCTCLVKADGPTLRRHVREGTVAELCVVPGLAA